MTDRAAELRRSPQALRLLARASDLLEVTLEVSATRAAVARLWVPDLADACALHVLDAGAWCPVAVACADPAEEALAEERTRRQPPTAAEAHALAAASREGAPALAALAPGEGDAWSGRAPGPRALLRLPLAARGRSQGVLSLLTAAPHRRFGPEEVALAAEVSRVAALALDNAHLHQEAVAAGRRKEEEARVSELLRRLGSSFSLQLDLERLVQQIADEAVALIGARFGACFYRREHADGRVFRRHALCGLEAGELPAIARAWAERLVGPEAPAPEAPRAPRALESHLALPIVSSTGEVLGGLFLGHPDPGAFTVDHERTARGVAAQAGVALDNARLFDRARRAEERSRQSEERLLIALEAGRMGYFEQDLLTGKVYVSATLLEIFGLSPDAFDGDAETLRRYIHPEDQAVRRQSRERFLASGQPTHSSQYRIVRADGAVRWLENHSKLVMDRSGRPVRVLGVRVDVTERKAAEEQARRLEVEKAGRQRERELQARRVHYEALRADVGTALSGQEGLSAALERCGQALVQHLDVWAARLWTLRPLTAELELQVGAGACPAPDEPPFLASMLQERRPYLTNDVAGDPHPWDKAWARREGVRALAAYPLAVGESFIGAVVVLSTRPLPEDTLAVLGPTADAIAQGIERRRAELSLAGRAEELARSNTELEQFAYVASHDLQEPLRMVASFTQLLARRYKGRLDPEADEYITFAVDGVLRMKRLIRDLLSYSRVGSLGQHLVPTEAGGALEAALVALKGALEESGAEVTAGPLPRVLADEVQLTQVFQNLVGNALKFRGAERPRVHVSATREGSAVRFAVRDNGIGIEPQYFERIFVIFQRLHTGSVYPGTGIGLAICKRVVERHGGRIWVESTPGQGSTFHFTLSAAQETTLS